MRASRWCAWALLAASACQAEAPAGSESSPRAAAAALDGDDLAVRLAPRIGYGRAVAKLDASGERVLVGLHRPPLPESDERPLYEVLRWDARDDSLSPVHDAARSAVFGGAALWVVDENDVLLRLDGAGKHQVVDRVHGRPAPLHDGTVVVSRLGPEPGESDLWLVPARGAAEPFAAAPGPDEMPIALPDGRIAFVSGRTTVSSLWIADPVTKRVRQLTNRGLFAGGDLRALVPTPVRVIEVTARWLTYDAGVGEVIRVDLVSGRAIHGGPSR